MVEKKKDLSDKTWTKEWINAPTERQSDGRMDGMTDELKYGKADGRTDGRSEGQTDGGTDGGTEGRTDVQTVVRTDNRSTQRTNERKKVWINKRLTEWMAGLGQCDRARWCGVLWPRTSGANQPAAPGPGGITVHQPSPHQVLAQVI